MPIITIDNFNEFIKKLLQVDIEEANIEDIDLNVESPTSYEKTLKILKWKGIDIKNVKKMITISNDNKVVISNLTNGKDFLGVKPIFNELETNLKNNELLFVADEENNQIIKIYRISFEDNLPYFAFVKNIHLSDFEQHFSFEKVIFTKQINSQMTANLGFILGKTVGKLGLVKNFAEQILKINSQNFKFKFIIYRDQDKLYYENFEGQKRIIKSSDDAFSNLAEDDIFYFDEGAKPNETKIYKLNFKDAFFGNFIFLYLNKTEANCSYCEFLPIAKKSYSYVEDLANLNIFNKQQPDFKELKIKKTVDHIVNKREAKDALKKAKKAPNTPSSEIEKLEEQISFLDQLPALQNITSLNVQIETNHSELEKNIINCYKKLTREDSFFATNNLTPERFQQIVENNPQHAQLESINKSISGLVYALTFDNNKITLTRIPSKDSEESIKIFEYEQTPEFKKKTEFIKKLYPLYIYQDNNLPNRIHTKIWAPLSEKPEEMKLILVKDSEVKRINNIFADDSLFFADNSSYNLNNKEIKIKGLEITKPTGNLISQKNSSPSIANAENAESSEGPAILNEQVNIVNNVINLQCNNLNNMWDISTSNDKLSIKRKLKFIHDEDSLLKKIYEKNNYRNTVIVFNKHTNAFLRAYYFDGKKRVNCSNNDIFTNEKNRVALAKIFSHSKQRLFSISKVKIKDFSKESNKKIYRLVFSPANGIDRAWWCVRGTDTEVDITARGFMPRNILTRKETFFLRSLVKENDEIELIYNKDNKLSSCSYIKNGENKKAPIKIDDSNREIFKKIETIFINKNMDDPNNFLNNVDHGIEYFNKIIGIKESSINGEKIAKENTPFAKTQTTTAFAK